MALYKMGEILADAQARGYGVGFFNTINLEMIRACVEAGGGTEFACYYRHGGSALAHRPV